MIGARGWLLLACAVFASFVLRWWLADDDQPRNAVGPTRTSFLLHDFQLEKLRDDGSIAARIAAPRLTRHDGDGSLYVDEPKFSLPDAAGNRWHGGAEFARITAHGEQVSLQGTVSMQRPEDAPLGPARVATANLTIWPDGQRAASDSASTLWQPGRMLEGSSLRIDLATDHYRMSDVHGTFAVR